MENKKRMTGTTDHYQTCDTAEKALEHMKAGIEKVAKGIPMAGITTHAVRYENREGTLVACVPATSGCKIDLEIDWVKGSGTMVTRLSLSNLEPHRAALEQKIVEEFNIVLS